MDLVTCSFFILAPVLLLILIFKSAAARKGRNHKNLPPGPRPWPVIGNLVHMGTKPHISLAKQAQVHGPIISLRLGSQLLVVGSTPAAAAEILKTHDRLLSGRYLPKAGMPNLYPFSLVWAAECSENWKALRALCRSELFSVKAVEAQCRLRENKVDEMVRFLSGKQGEAVNVGEVVFATVFNTLGNICFSRDFVDLNEEVEGDDHGLKGLIWKMMEIGSTPNIADFYPVFERWDPQGLRKRLTQAIYQLFALWEIILKERRAVKNRSNENQDFLDVMIASDLSDTGIQLLAMELFTAGTETTTVTIEWAIGELLKNKEAMNKVRAELTRELTSSTTIRESQMSQLPYLHACIKETYRLHTPVPFLIPHHATETCQIMNYTVPKNSQVIVNLWAIGHDPAVWEEPTSFKPERFLESSVDFKGQDFELLPFGAGRRMCPGMPLASKQVGFILANLLHKFDWFLPGDGDHSQIDMSEKFGLTLRLKKPLLLIPKQKSY